MTAQGCTELGCSHSNPATDDEKMCAGDWLYSHNIRYNDQPDFVNNCINGYRANTYNEMPNKKDFGSKHAAFALCLKDIGGKDPSVACQEGYKNYFPTAADITQSQKRDALENAMRACTTLHDSLINEHGFSAQKINAFGQYFSHRKIAPVHQKIKIDGADVLTRDVQNEVMGYIITSKNVFPTGAVTPQMAEQFQRDYARETRDAR